MFFKRMKRSVKNILSEQKEMVLYDQGEGKEKCDARTKAQMEKFNKDNDINAVRRDLNSEAAVPTEVMSVYDRLKDKADGNSYKLAEEMKRNKTYYNGDYTPAYGRDVKLKRMFHKKMKNMI